MESGYTIYIVPRYIQLLKFCKFPGNTSEVMEPKSGGRKKLPIINFGGTRTYLEGFGGRSPLFKEYGLGIKEANSFH